MREGKYFIASNFSLEQQYWFEANHPSYVQSSEATEIIYLDMNFRRPPFDDAAIRRALSLSIDRRTLVRDFLQQPDGEQSRLLFPWLPHVDDIPFGAGLAPYQQRLAAARDMMRSKGYSASKPLKIRLFVSVTREAVAPGLAAMLRQAYFEPVIEILPHEQMYVKRLVPGEFELGLVSWRLVSMNPEQLMAVAYCTAAGEGFFNYGKSCDSEYNQLIEKARDEQNSLAKMRWLVAADRRLVEANLKIPLYQSYSTNLSHPGISGFNKNRFRANPSFLLGGATAGN